MIKKALLIIGFCMAGTLTGMHREKSRRIGRPNVKRT